MLVVRGGGALRLAGQEDALRPPKYLFATARARAWRRSATHVAATFFRTTGTVSAQSTPSCLPGFFAPKQNRFGLQDLPALSLRSSRNLVEAGAASASAPPRSHRAISAVRRHVVSPFLSAAAITRCRRNQFPAVEASHVWGGSPTSSKLSCGERNGRTLACCLPAFRVGLLRPAARPAFPMSAPN